MKKKKKKFLYDSEGLISLGLPSWLWSIELIKTIKEELKEEASHRTFSLNDMFDKLNAAEQNEVKHAQIKWELLRLNTAFKKDFEEWAEKMRNEKQKHSDFFDSDGETIAGDYDEMSKKFSRKWKINKPEELHPEFSFNELIEKCTERLKKLCDFLQKFTHFRRPNDIDLYLNACRFVSRFVSQRFSEGLKPNPPVYCYPPEISAVVRDTLFFTNTGLLISQDFINTGIAKITVDFTCSKNHLVKQLISLINELQPHIAESAFKKRKLRKPRLRHNYDNYFKYLSALELKRSGLSNKDIAKRIMPNDYTVEPRVAEEKVRQYCKEAERLIKNVADF